MRLRTATSPTLSLIVWSAAVLLMAATPASAQERPPELYAQLAPVGGASAAPVVRPATFHIADDFLVPNGDVWDLTHVLLTIAWLPEASISLAIHADGGGRPGAIILDAPGLTSYTVTDRPDLPDFDEAAQTQDYLISLPDTVRLTEGAYWLSVQLAKGPAEEDMSLSWAHLEEIGGSLPFGSFDGGSTWLEGWRWSLRDMAFGLYGLCPGSSGKNGTACGCTAAPIRWTNGAGGQFDEAENWEDGILPNHDDVVRFGLGSQSYSVSLPSPTENAGLAVDASDRVQLELSFPAGTYRLSGASGCLPALSVGPAALSRLEVMGGTFVEANGVRVSGPGADLVLSSSGASRTGLSVGGTLNVSSNADVPDTARVIVTSSSVLGTADTIIGEQAGTRGVVRLTGSGSEWRAEGMTTIGWNGEGLVELGAATFLHMKDLWLGVEAGGALGRGTGTLTADAAVIDVSGTLVVGGRGRGTLMLRGFTLLGRPSGTALLPIPIASIGQGLQSRGSVTVGDLSWWAVSELIVGEQGTGELTILSGGRVDVGSAVVSARTGSNGTVRVDGAGSKLAGQYMLLSGPGGGAGNTTGPALLEVRNGGVVELQTLEIGSPLGQVLVLGGTLRVQSTIPSKTDDLEGTTVRVDSLIVHGDSLNVQADSVALGPGGYLGGSGIFPFDLTNIGVLAPSDASSAVGTFRAGGDYSQDSSGVLEIDLAAADNHDRIVVAGEAVLGGTVRIKVLNGYKPEVGQTFEFVRAGSISGTFERVELPKGTTLDLVYSETSVTATVLTGVGTEEEITNELPSRHTLAQNYPNPFNPETTIAYELRAPSLVRLVVHDVFGREVRVLVDGIEVAGHHEVMFSAEGLASGTYFYRLITPTGAITRQMNLLK